MTNAVVVGAGPNGLAAGFSTDVAEYGKNFAPHINATGAAVRIVNIR
ncbi:MAG: hypothetical protein QOI30_1911, partial [Mycobacterium sp.]|nr:hypothetical protein [Mycobacterium sp.]